MKAFSERNPITLAVVGLAVIVAIVVATFYADDLPVIGGGNSFSANFSDAGGLQSGDDVRIAGVRVGSVDSISLHRAHVHVEFTVRDAWVGDQTTAAIKIKTLLGQEYLALDPLGSHGLADDATIPQSRTTSPLDVQEALSGLGSRAGAIDTAQLARSFDALSATFSNTPATVRTALTGLSRLSETISSRDAQLRTLAANTAAVTKQLADSNSAIASLLSDGASLLDVLRERSAAITSLLDGTTTLSAQLVGLVHDNQKTIGPALEQLSRVTTILTNNRSHLDKALKLIGPYYSLLTDATGNGPWLDTYICGLFTASGTPVLNATAKRTCSPKSGGS